MNWVSTQSRPCRKIRWTSAKHGDYSALMQLQQQLVEFYSNLSYFEELSASDGWTTLDNPVYQDLVNVAKDSTAILEVGCGKAAILEAEPALQEHYTGVDFSEALIARNRAKYPHAEFYQLTAPNHLPFDDESFDYVFSVWVIEHTVFPHLFLHEKARVLRKDGMLAILCPNFLESGRMTSQRSGFSPGTGREKLKKGKLWDAVVTGWDNRIRIPLECLSRRLISRFEPHFWVNLAPTCFTDQFTSDVDAVYVVSEYEIQRELKRKIAWQQLPEHISKFCKHRQLTYVRGRSIL